MDPIDTTDPTWIQIKRYAQTRIKVQERVLRTIGLSPVDTEAARYAIAELEALLKFPKPSSMSVVESEGPD